MLELDELKAQMKTYEEPMQQMRSSLDLDNKEKRIEELERTMAEPGFWENPEKAQKLQKELGSLRNGIDAFKKLENLYEETLMMNISRPGQTMSGMSVFKSRTVSLTRHGRTLSKTSISLVYSSQTNCSRLIFP